MRTVLESAVREFVKADHLKSLANGEWLELRQEDGTILQGIRGRAGAFAMSSSGMEIGADLIEMEPGAAFALHVHPGDHVLYVLEGSVDGMVHIDGVDHTVRPGDTIFIPAEYPHGVKTFADAAGVFRFVAFGHPHKAVDAKDRMRLVQEEVTST